MIGTQLTLPVLPFPAVIGAPQVEHIPYVRSIKFLIRPPFTPLRGEDEQQLTVEDIYSKFGAVHYHLTIFNQRTHQQVQHNLGTGMLQIPFQMSWRRICIYTR